MYSPLGYDYLYGYGYDKYHLITDIFTKNRIASVSSCQMNWQLQSDRSVFLYNYVYDKGRSGQIGIPRYLYYN